MKRQPAVDTPPLRGWPLAVGQASFYIVALLVIFLVRNNPFFWDTIQLASKHAHYYYETNFQSLLLPEEIDSGHPPVFGMYIASLWVIFGKNLPVSHFAMLPFLWGIIFFLLKIGEKLASKKYAPFLVLLCFADPVLAGQSVLVSPDIALVCFFLMALWAIWENRPGWLALAFAGLGMVSMRGMMLGVGLFVFSIFVEWQRSGFGKRLQGNFNRFSPSCPPQGGTLHVQQTLKSPLEGGRGVKTFNWYIHFFKKLLPFLPGGLLAAAFLFFHWQQTGWIGYHEGSTWAPSFERVGLRGFIKNVAVLGWRFLDFGRVFLWAGLAIAALFWWKRRAARSRKKGLPMQLLALFLLTFLTLVPTQLFYKGLLAHRYLLPVFLSLTLLFYWLIFNKIASKKNRNLLFALAFLGLATGNLWVYPKKISIGWDSTLAHLPWYGLQKEMTDYIEKQEIPWRHAGTAFPNIGSHENMALDGIRTGFPEKDLNSQCYIFYSNVMNDFSDEEIDELESHWAKEKVLVNGGVCVILYKNPDLTKCEN